MFIIAGLGNPDEKYQGTRHNVGFDVVDRLAEKYQIAVDTKKHRALIGKGVIEGQKVLLVKPQTYMNLSGESIRSLVEYYKIDPEEELLVIYDDISLEALELCGEWGTGKVFKGLTRSMTHHPLKQWIAEAGIIKHITFHCFRHTYATLQLANGTDIYTVSKMLGHTNVKTTQIYASAPRMVA